ncbi:hypothetical protein RCH33_426 [Flavobacterium daejeonense]|nr:hypothetical protein RCH33_426 [Flavobacterium daejeonense]
MNTDVFILFYIKKTKVNSLGVCPIYTRVTVIANFYIKKAESYKTY